jgi:hypothetical protein
MYNSLNRDIEHFGDIYDRRINEYDNCEGVGEVIEKIRNNDPSWKSEDIVKQVPCIPIYKWDGKFYKDEVSAEAGLTGSDAEEITSPSDSGTLVSATDEKHPGGHVRKKGKFILSSHWASDWASKIALNSNGKGWLSREDRHNTDDNWLQMETVSGDIEMIKGVVTKGRHDKHKYYVKKFKVFVSRNGDSWKQMKDMNNNEEFTGNSDSNYKEGKKNYFNEVVEAKYIRVYPTEHNSYPALRLGYIKDLSGTVNCTGGSGMFNDTPWFRFTFDEANTKSKSTYSEGDSDSNKLCPTNGNVMVRQKGNITIGDNNIPVGDLKIIQGGIVKGLKGVMGNKTLRACGADPSSEGWYSSSSEGSKKTWSSCVKPSSGLASSNIAYHTNDGGYRYMYRHWSGSNNNSIYDTGDGYNKWSDSDPPYKDNTQNSNANNGSTYSVPSTDFELKDYDKVNIVRQPCNRGTKGVLPTLGTGWTSDICSCEGQASTGYSGTIYNITGGTEGWIDQVKKYTWANFFNNELQNLVTAKLTSGSFQLAVNEYKVVEKEGVTNSDNYARWSTTYGNAKSAIDGDTAWHCSSNSSAKWNTSLDFDRSIAMYDQDTEFMPIGIKIQPRKNSTGWDSQSPTEIRLVWSDGSTEKFQKVTLDTFATKDTIKTILINPNKRTKTKKLHVYARHGRNNQWVSFRINYLIGEINGGKSIDKGTIDCKNNEKRPVECKEGSAAGVESSYGAWTNRSVSWSYDAECSKNSNDNWSRKKKKTSGQQAQRYYKTVAAKHGGRNNCTRKIEDTKYRDVNDSDSCSWSYKSGVNEACYWIGSGNYYSVREGKNSTSANSAATACKTLTNTKERPYCQFLHTSSDGGQYALETRSSCSPQKCHRPGSGKCNAHGGWGGWMV